MHFVGARSFSLSLSTNFIYLRFMKSLPLLTWHFLFCHSTYFDAVWQHFHDAFCTRLSWALLQNEYKVMGTLCTTEFLMPFFSQLILAIIFSLCWFYFGTLALLNCTSRAKCKWISVTYEKWRRIKSKYANGKISCKRWNQIEISCCKWERLEHFMHIKIARQKHFEFHFPSMLKNSN